MQEKELLDTTGDASKRQEGDRHSKGLGIDESRVHNNVCITYADNNNSIPYVHRKIREVATTMLTLVIQRLNIA